MPGEQRGNTAYDVHNPQVLFWCVPGVQLHLKAQYGRRERNRVIWDVEGKEGAKICLLCWPLVIACNACERIVSILNMFSGIDVVPSIKRVN